MIKKYIKIIFLNSILLPYVSNSASVKTPIKPALSPVFDEKKYLDRLFAQNGVGTAFIPSTIPGKTSNDTGTPMALQADGCIVVARPSDSKKHFAIARYLPTGEIDRTFGKMGIQSIDCSLTKKESIDTVTALAIQDDGKIVVAGQSQSNTTCSFAVARFNANGTVDTTFGKVGTPQAGTQSIDFSIGGGNSDKVTGVIIQSDGKLVVGGYTTTPTSSTRFALARFNANGTLDTTFGRVKTSQAGTQCLRFCIAGGTSDTPTALALQQDGKIVLGGHSATPASFFHSTATRFAIARFNPDGTLDTTFGTIKTPQAGTQFLTFSIVPAATEDKAMALAIQQDGKIVLGGYSGNPGSLLRFATARFALARFNADAGLDTSFGKIGTLQAGTQYIDFPYQMNSFDAAYSIAMQADGKIILGGISCPTYTYIYPSHFALARFNQNGSLDTTFNQTGTHLIGLSITGGKFNPADAIVLESKGGILAN